MTDQERVDGVAYVGTPSIPVGTTVEEYRRARYAAQVRLGCLARAISKAKAKAKAGRSC